MTAQATPEQVLASIVEGINTGNLEALMNLYENQAAFASQPGTLAHGLQGIRKGLAGFMALKGRLDLNVTRVLEAGGLALVVGEWSFTGTSANGEPVTLAAWLRAWKGRLCRAVRHRGCHKYAWPLHRRVRLPPGLPYPKQIDP